MSEDAGLALLTSTFTENEAEVIRCLLEANGIQAQVTRDRAFPSVEGVAAEHGVRVMVPAADLAEASRIIDEARAEARAEARTEDAAEDDEDEAADDQ